MRSLLALAVTGMALTSAAVPTSAQTLLLPPASGGVSSSQGDAPVRRLSLEDAVRLALERNLGLQVERYNPQIQDLSVAAARAAWTPTLTATVDDGTSNVPSSSLFAGALGKVTRDQFATTLGWQQALPWGVTYAVAWGNARVRSNGLFDTPNPAVGSTITGSFVQPLARDFGIDRARAQVRVAKTRSDLSRIEVTQATRKTIRSVKVAYWELAYARSSLAVRRQSLDLARAALGDSRSRLAAGMAARLDVVEAEAEVAQRAEAVIVGEAGVSGAEDRLRALVFDPAAADFWTTTLELTDTGTVQPTPMEADAAIRRALEQRADLQAARKNVEIADTDIRYWRNQALPDVRVQVDHALAGQAGTTVRFGPGFPPPIVGREYAGYGRALGNLIDNKSWSVSLSVAYPIGTSAAEADLARTTLLRNQAQASIRNLELRIATEVRGAGRQVNMNAKRIEATRVARQLAAERLDAEQKRRAAGMSTTFLVFQAQRDLAQALDAELRSTLAYDTSLAEFEAVQEIPSVGPSATPITGTGAPSAASFVRAAVQTARP